MIWEREREHQLIAALLLINCIHRAMGHPIAFMGNCARERSYLFLCLITPPFLSLLLLIIKILSLSLSLSLERMRDEDFAIEIKEYNKMNHYLQLIISTYGLFRIKLKLELSSQFSNTGLNAFIYCLLFITFCKRFKLFSSFN